MAAHRLGRGASHRWWLGSEDEQADREREVQLDAAEREGGRWAVDAHDRGHALALEQRASECSELRGLARHSTAQARRQYSSRARTRRQ